MHIIELQAENLKKLRAVSIRPDGRLVQISGPNGQGKTSVLDAIWWCLAGKGTIQSEPIRRGEEEARIYLDLGEMKVTRKFRKVDGGTFTTSIAVENAEGARYSSPQAVLDGLMGALSFDPLAFMRMKEEDQLDALRRFVPDVDFEAIEKANAADYAARTDVNRRAKEARTRAEGISLPASMPDVVDDADLVAQLEEAGEHNAEIERRRARRETVARDVQDAYAKKVECEVRAMSLRAEADRLAEMAAEHDNEADALQAKLDAAPPLPEPIDTAALRQQIDDARKANARAAEASRARSDRESLLADAKEHEAKSESLTKAMKARDREKDEAIAAATMPVAGLGFGPGHILLNGLPMSQASDAEQLRTSIAIAMAMNPKLRVIRVRDGSLLDENAMRILAEMAEGADCQVWIERVDTSGTVGFVMEDGSIVGQPALQAAE